MPLTEEQLAQRAAGIGSSEIAAVAGEDPYSSPMQVWLRKTGKMPDHGNTQASHWGDVLEPIIANEWAQRNDAGVQKVLRTYAKPGHPIAMATPDYFIDGRDDELLEIKAPGYMMSKAWGKTDDVESVPKDKICQVQWQLLVTQREIWHLAALIGGQDYRQFTGTGDNETQMGLLFIAETFMEKHVRADIPPELDASPETKRWLADRYRKLSGNIRQATEDEAALAERYAQARRDEKEAKGRKELAAVGLMMAIGEDDGIEGAFGRSTYRLRKGFFVPARQQAATRVLNVKAETDEEIGYGE